jgi:hypothetical protein
MKHHTIKFANWLKWNNLNNVLEISIATSVFVVLVVFLLSLKRKRRALTSFLNRSAQSKFSVRNIYDNKKGIRETIPAHSWYLNDLFTKPTYCNNILKCFLSLGLRLLNIHFNTIKVIFVNV